jgi:hypothetical protein
MSAKLLPDMAFTHAAKLGKAADGDRRMLSFVPPPSFDDMHTLFVISSL